MTIVFRVDASVQIGIGHVMRCLTLAEALRNTGEQVEFICRKFRGNLIHLIQSKGFFVYELPIVADDVTKKKRKYTTDKHLSHSNWLGTSQHCDAELCVSLLKDKKPSWLIVDHYAIDATWQSLLKRYCQKLMVIDDLGDRHHTCDLLLDQNFGSSNSKYEGLVSNECAILTGSSYALLRPEFIKLREYSLQRRVNSQLKSVLISFGGVDPKNYTTKALEIIKMSALPRSIEITIVMGVTAPNIGKVKQLVETFPYETEIKVNVTGMAKLMANADLAIGATGATTLERCCLGLPSIQAVIADNQKLIAENLSSINAIKYIEKMEDINTLLLTADNWMHTTSQRAASICDGAGTVRVIEAIRVNGQ